MRRVHRQNTSANAELRRQLYACGLRYRVRVPILTKPHRVADLAFSGIRAATFVDGFFWHGCPVGATWPKTNADSWRSNILTKMNRAVDTDRRLRELGWAVVRAWAH
jgi:DNA mismatch endonuclease (patch repair protein)